MTKSAYTGLLIRQADSQTKPALTCKQSVIVKTYCLILTINMSRSYARWSGSDFFSTSSSVRPSKRSHFFRTRQTSVIIFCLTALRFVAYLQQQSTFSHSLNQQRSCHTANFLWHTFGWSAIRSPGPTQPGHPSLGRCNLHWRWFRPLLGKKRPVPRSSRPRYQDCWHTGLLYAVLKWSNPRWQACGNDFSTGSHGQKSKLSCNMIRWFSPTPWNRANC